MGSGTIGRQKGQRIVVEGAGDLKHDWKSGAREACLERASLQEKPETRGQWGSMQVHRLSSGAVVFVPDGVQRRDSVPVTLHLHGAPATVSDAFQRSRRDGILVVMTLPGLSSVYTRHFAADPGGRLAELVDGGLRAARVGAAEALWVSSFSAGFGAVRELLRESTSFSRIDTLILADTLYAGFARAQSGSEDRPEPDLAHLAGFARFATEAAAGRKGMLATWCDLLPDGYSATRETGAVLRAITRSRVDMVSEPWPEAMTLTSKARAGRFASFGFAGADGAAHLAHLRGLWMWYRLVPRVA